MSNLNEKKTEEYLTVVSWFLLLKIETWNGFARELVEKKYKYHH